MNRMIKIVKQFISDRKIRFSYLASAGFLNWMSDKEFIKRKFEIEMGYSLDLDTPKAFNEKLQWLKLNFRENVFTDMVDKEKAKEYVADRIGEEYIVQTLGVWNCFEEIDFSSLPNQFVLKCTHDSGGIVICKNKRLLDTKKAKKTIQQGLRKNYYYTCREWPYKNVTPRIIAEAYLEDSVLKELRDYKFFCFAGKVRCFKIDFDRYINHHANYYDREGNLMGIGEVIDPPDPSRNIKMPSQLSKMINLAEVLSKGFPFLRVDFYEVDAKVYFGELTFFPGAGFNPFQHYEDDLLLGSWMRLPTDKDPYLIV